MTSNFVTIWTFYAVVVLFNVGSCKAQNLNYGTIVSIYDQPDFKGNFVKDLNLEAVPYYDLANLGFKGDLSSLTIDTGTCVELHVNPPPAVNDPNSLFVSWDWLKGQRNPKIDQLGAGKFAFLKSCGVHTLPTICPESMYMTELRWNDGGYFTDGVETGCKHPSSEIVQTKARSNGDQNLDKHKTCVAFGGLYVSQELASQRVVALDPYCYAKELVYKDEQTETHLKYTEDCAIGEAVIGVTLDLENNSYFVKGIYPICQVPNVGRDCIPSDKTNELTACGSASDNAGEIGCSSTKAVGTTVKTGQSEEHSRESSFYYSFDVNIGASVNALSVNFGANVKVSNNTGYAWSNATEDAYHTLYTYVVNAKTYAGYKTYLQEVVGSCGFLEAKPNYFKRVDVAK